MRVSRTSVLLVLATLAALTALRIDGGVNRWTQTFNGRSGFELLVADPTQPSILYGQFDVHDGLQKSTNGGTTYAPATSGLPGALELLEISPSSPSTLYAVSGGQAYRTVNGGASWTARVSSGLQAGSQHLRVDPSNPSRLFLTEPGLQRSDDGGGSWTQLEHGCSGSVHDVAIDPTLPSRLLLACYPSAVRGSTDGGSSWAPLSTFNPGNAVTVFRIAPSNPQVVYGAGGKLERSTDGGASWTQRDLPFLVARQLVVDPLDPMRLHALSGDGGTLWRSTNGGDSWSPGGVPNGFLNILLAPQASRLYVTRHQGPLFASTDGGDTFFEPAAAPAPARVLAVDPADHRLVIAGVHSYPYSITRTTDGGETWSRRSTTGDAVPLGVVFGPAGTETVRVLTSGGGILRSDDRGASWQAAPSPRPIVTQLFLFPDRLDLQLAVTDLDVFRSTDGGVTWSGVSFPGYPTIPNLALQPKDPTVLYASSIYSFYRSSDRGVSWQLLVEGLTVCDRGLLAIPPEDPSTIYQLCEHLKRSTDGGNTFVDVSGINALSMAFDPRNPRKVYATYPYTVARCVDGVTFKNFDLGFVGLARTVVAHPDGHHLYLGAEEGVSALTLDDRTDFFTVPPCRAVDTRGPDGPFGGPALAGGTRRAFALSGTCGIPPGARSVAANVTVVQPTAAGHIRAAVQGVVPPTSLLNFRAGQIRANSAVLPLTEDSTGSTVIQVEVPPGDSLHLLIDVNGYFLSPDPLIGPLARPD